MIHRRKRNHIHLSHLNNYKKNLKLWELSPQVLNIIIVVFTSSPNALEKKKRSIIIIITCAPLLPRQIPSSFYKDL